MAGGDHQYAYLSVVSDDLTPDELTALIGLEPTDVRERGSRRSAHRPVPRMHLWSFRPAGEPGFQMEGQLQELAAVLRDHAAALRALVDSGSAIVSLQLVRHLEDVAENSHLGFRLERDVLEALADAGAVVDVDEYP